MNLTSSMWLTWLWLLAFQALHLVNADKRAPPFTIAGQAVHLGNYTHSHDDVEAPSYTCVSTGECDVCTPLEKKTMPYCMRYGNKEPVRCQWDDPGFALRKNETSFQDDDAVSLPSFQECAHVKRVEQWKLVRFEGINLMIAVLSVMVFVWRQRKLAREQYNRLTERIGTIS